MLFDWELALVGWKWSFLSHSQLPRDDGWMDVWMDD